MPFALIGFFLAYSEHPELSFRWELLLFVVLCMVFARNVAMGFNRYADRHIDAKNIRTKGRDIPSGKFSPKTALWFIIINIILFCTTCAFINTLTLLLAPVALFVVIIYSYTKRFTALCHFVLGLSLSIAPIGAYISVTGAFAVTPLLYSAIVLLWSTGFDIIYALQDEDFDKEHSLKSIPAGLGIPKAMLVSNLLHFGVAILVIILGIYKSHTLFYTIGATIFIILLGFQHLIISPTNLKRINAAFFTTNGIASVAFAIFNILELYFPIDIM
jgi:4-hydroxybenzoate polyprenyltransferase